MIFLKKPSAWIPLVMSVLALLLVLCYIWLFGIQNPSEDESVIARLFQLLLFGQLPIIGYFFFKWFYKNPKQVSLIVVMQLLAALVPFLTVFFLEM